MSSKLRRLYTGFTDDIFNRVIQHKEKRYPASFTARYVYDVLVFYEEYSHAISARTREKEIKGWTREKKLKLILAQTPDCADLGLEWREGPGWNLLPDARSKLKRKPPQN